MSLGQRIRKLRKSKHINQADVAEMFSTSVSTISAYERDIHSPDTEMLVKLANFYNTNVDYLLGNTNIQTSWHTYEKEIELLQATICPEELFSKFDSLDCADRAFVVRIINSLL